MYLLEKLFHLKENNAKLPTEILGGVLSFFAMSYILIVNPDILSGSGMGWGAVFIATILTTIFGTLLLGLIANVPLSQSVSPGLNAFFTTTVCIAFGFSWQEGLVIVFLSGILGIILTITNTSKQIISGIPAFLRNGISCGLGGFLALVGLNNIHLITYTNGVPALGNLTDISIILFFVGLFLIVILEIKKVPAGLFIGLIAVTLIGIPFGLTTFDTSISVSDAFSQFPQTFGAVFTAEGFPALFSDFGRLPLALILIVTFTMLTLLNSIGTIIGAGRKIGLMTESEMKQIMSKSKLHKTRSERALLCSVSASVFGAVCGTSTVTPFAESIAGIEAGARTGLASCITALCFALCLFITPLISVIPACATAPVLVIIGIKMMAPLAEIAWNKFEEAVPAFFITFFMVMAYNIADGIVAGLGMYCIIKLCKKEFKAVNPLILIFVILYVVALVIRILYT